MYIASLIFKGKHTTEAGRELIIKISKGMNNNRLTTNVDNKNIEIPENLIKEVLNLEDIHIKDKDGLRIKALSNTLINNQLFYILASGHKTIVFKGSKECADYFGVSVFTINNRLAKDKPLITDANNLEFVLSRKPL